MGVFSWFSKSGSKGYEERLAKLASEIEAAKTHLSEVRLRERRFKLAINAYGIGLWAIWVGLWYFDQIPWGLVGWSSHGNEARAVGTAIVAAGPILLLSIIFTRIRISDETRLRLLLSKQRTAIDEIKKATNYDSTRKLIEQYDEAGGPQRGQQRGPQSAPNTPPSAGSGPSTPNNAQGSQPGVLNAPGPQGPQGPVGPDGTPRAPGHLAGGTPRPSTPVPIPPGMTPEQAHFLQTHMQAIQPILPTPEKKCASRGEQVRARVRRVLPAQRTGGKQAGMGAYAVDLPAYVGVVLWQLTPGCNHLNPSPLQRAAEAGDDDMFSTPGPIETPSKPVTLRSAPSPTPLRRRLAGQRAGPGSSRLSTEVFSAQDDSDEEGDSVDDAMDVDKDK
ncbi:hypothetical protein A1Q1_04263 [Trichosporon asahii var. asahii CBS 2479]|uniref:Endoplasmic reticulum junction formation protein lunapark n=1 Tax=Trichosporon asahii var. asahii (strain ATCC 90039 / CBS 2479 / JCM 2466 / KCTC 7840 / NBRC 103889/ NCYC 2677 / UAMH 7654) TaxID=1186058 RepID=J4U8Z7_TRIAS|nr:hypothetical protein A1Q1_04263 [Trichosporon asahii var. asahii CBS 2479]EJT47020.1 hypothetical protein A1Q1_04263 [Trichosporon asahii var. asahii CBS 2479]